jgi:hypothetical protein
MSNGYNIFDNNLFRANLIPTDIKLFVVTKDRLSNISASSFLNDITIFISSLIWGAYFSLKIALSSNTDMTELQSKTLTTYCNIFFWLGIIFIIFFILTKINQYRQIYGITKSKLKFSNQQNIRLNIA